MIALLLALADVTRPGLAYQVTYSYNLDGVPSPDGKRLLFIRIIEGKQQLFTMAIGGGGERQITSDAADHEDPAWSPDGSQIASVRIEGGRKIIHVIRPDGSQSRPVTPASQHAIHPSWTPDGARILYCTDDDLRPPEKNEAQIFAVNVRNGAVTTLISGGINTYPAMSPDGRWIAFRKIVGEMNSEVFVANADGKGLRNLTNDPAWEGWPAWSPDSRRIAFAGNRNSNYQIFVMDADGGNVRLAANTEGRATAPRWSGDGKTLNFTNCMSVDFGRHCEVMAVPAP